MHAQLASGRPMISLPDPSRRMWARKWPRSQSPCATSDRSLNKVPAAPRTKTENLHKPYFNCILHDRPRDAYFSWNRLSTLTWFSFVYPITSMTRNTRRRYAYTLPPQCLFYSTWVTLLVLLPFFFHDSIWLKGASGLSFLRHASHGPWNSKKEIKKPTTNHHPIQI